MLGNFLRRSADIKQRANKGGKKKVEIDGHASSGGQGWCAKCLLPMASARGSNVNLLRRLFFFVKTVFFIILELIKAKDTAISAES
jgi:hypothetical protein